MAFQFPARVRQKFHVSFFWQLMIAFALVILVAGGGVSLAGHIALNRMEYPFTRDEAPAIVTHPWANRLVTYYKRQSSWEGVDRLIAGYPCGPGWEPWEEDWKTDYLVASGDGVVVAASEEKWLVQVFFAHPLSDEEIIALFEAHADKSRQKLELFRTGVQEVVERRFAEVGSARSRRLWQFTLDYGIAHLEWELQWVENALEDLRNLLLC